MNRQEIHFRLIDSDLLIGKKVPIIKLIRSLTGSGLREAKNCADDVIGRGYGECEITSGSWTKGDKTERNADIASLKQLGIGVNNFVDKRQKKHIDQLRAQACVLVMEGNEPMARDLLDITERWGYIPETVDADSNPT